MNSPENAQTELFEGGQRSEKRAKRLDSGKRRYKDYEVDRAQHQIFATNVFDLLPEGHDCYLFADLIAQLDTGEADKHYSSLGQRAYDPRQLIGILIYSYSRGVFSSRAIEQRCREDLGFMYIAGSNCPNFRVLSDFRKAHQMLLHSCFVQTVRLAIELKLASLAHISLDGSKFKANSSKHKAMSYAKLKEREQQLTEQIDELVAQAARQDEQEDQQYQDRTGYEASEDLTFKKNRLAKIQEAKAALEKREQQRHPDKLIEDKKQISFADQEANIMGKGTNVTYAYNAQISVDSDKQIIVAQHISQMANDYAEVVEALNQIELNCAALPEKISMDNGYFSGQNLAALEQRSTQAFVATNRIDKSSVVSLHEGTRALVKADFKYEQEGDYFVCPAGQPLQFRSLSSDGRRTYQADASSCDECTLRDRCCNAKKGNGRRLLSDSHEAQRRRMVRHMDKSESKEIYDKRKVIVEPVFGQIKNTGFREFSLRGAVKVAGEFSLVSLTHNMKKMVRAAKEGLIRLEDGQWVAEHR